MLVAMIVQVWLTTNTGEFILQKANANSVSMS